MRTGDSSIESLRDGRNIILDGTRVDDVTTHPGFAGGVRTVARLYDFAADPANRELMTYESPTDGRPVNLSWLVPRSQPADAEASPDYGDFVQRLALDAETDPFEVLIRSEGWRATDRIEVFAHPERTPDGALTTLFFVRGVRHRDGAAEAVDSVRAGDVLQLADEPDNPVNPRAMLVSTRTGRRVGWVPDCLLDTIHELVQLGAAIEVIAEHVNPATSPPHMRLLCRLRAPWPDGYEPLTGPDYQPIAS